MTARWLAGAAAVAAVATAWAQAPAPAGGPADDAAQYRTLAYRYIGPPGNRTDAVTGVPGDPWTYYAGAASGGIFKSSDGGIHWAPIFDDAPVMSIGALAVAPSDANIVWAGTGESFIRSHISIGQGIFKSTDAGRTWKSMGLDKTGRIGRVLVHPSNPDIVLACALGTAYGPQPDRGVFRTIDGGAHWDRVLFVDENTGCSDLAMDPGNPRTVYAGTWQLVIHTWGRTSGGPGSGIFRSTDGGATWTRLTGRGLPRSPLGKIGLSVARSNPDRVYALIETGDGVPMNGEPTQIGQLWSSANGGESWEMMSTNRDLRSRTHYYTRNAISPGNEFELYFLGNNFTHSLDGGRTLTPLGGSPGGDNHDMWIDPLNPDRMIVANDSGISTSVDHGRVWTHVDLPIAQIYHVTVDDQIPYRVYGNEQDKSAYSGPSRLPAEGRGGGAAFVPAAATAAPAGAAETGAAPAAGGRGGGGRGGGGRGQAGVPAGAAPAGAAAAAGGRGGNLPRSVWKTIGGGESGFATPDPTDPNIVWSSGTGSGSIGGVVFVYDERTGQSHNVEVWPETTVGAPAENLKYRFNWEFPITISPFDHNRVYVGSQHVLVTMDRGNSWQELGPDLTRNDKAKQGISGGLTPDNIGVEYAGVVFAIAESPKQQGLIWAGTNDGYVQVSRDNGKTWTNVTKNIAEVPDWGTVDNIEPSHFNAGTAYLTVDAHQMDNRDPWVFKTTDFGATWTKITDGLPHGMATYAHCVREDPVRPGLLFLGTESGLFVTFDDGAHWQPLQNNLPHAPVYWLAIQNRFHDLAVSTYGRGIWILDDISPLETNAAAAVLLPIRDAYRFRGQATPLAENYDPSAGQNIAYGADINYFLPQSAGGPVRIAISDATGKVVRTLGGGAQPGLNRVFWDLRADSGTTTVRLRTLSPYAPDLALGADGTRNAPGVQGVSLMEPPGKYTVTLTAGGRDSTQPLNVLKDPHSGGTEADIQAQLKLAQSIQSDIDAVDRAINQVEVVRAQLATLGQVVADDPTHGRPVRDAATALDQKFFTFESTLYQVKATGRGEDEWRYAPALIAKLQYLETEVTSSDFPPTTQQVAVSQALGKEVKDARAALDALIAQDVATFNALLKQHNLGPIYASGR